MHRENDLDTYYMIHDTTILFCLTPLHDVRVYGPAVGSGESGLDTVFHTFEVTYAYSMTDGWMYT
jgi:hypothetical protein